MGKVELLNNGTAKVTYSDRINRIKIKVTKGEIFYVYNHVQDISVIPLQMGSGEYKIQVYGQTQGTKYKQVHSKTIKHISDGKSVFLNPNIIVEYSDTSNCVKKAKSIARTLLTPNEKIKAVAKHIKDKFEYDYRKAASAKNGVLNGYEPDVDVVYNTGRGICYDYSVVFAAMLRSVGIPCKVVFGYVGGGAAYHAWNEAYVDGRWVRHDLTFEDSGVKNYNDYTADKCY